MFSTLLWAIILYRTHKLRTQLQEQLLTSTRPRAFISLFCLSTYHISLRCSNSAMYSWWLHQVETLWIQTQSNSLSIIYLNKSSVHTIHLLKTGERKIFLTSSLQETSVPPHSATTGVVVGWTGKLPTGYIPPTNTLSLYFHKGYQRSQRSNCLQPLPH